MIKVLLRPLELVHIDGRHVERRERHQEPADDAERTTERPQTRPPRHRAHQRQQVDGRRHRGSDDGGAGQGQKRQRRHCREGGRGGDVTEGLMTAAPARARNVSAVTAGRAGEGDDVTESLMTAAPARARNVSAVTAGRRGREMTSLRV